MFELRGGAGGLSQKSAVLSVKGPVVNILGFAYTVSTATAQLCQRQYINERGAWVYVAVDSTSTALLDLALI